MDGQSFEASIFSWKCVSGDSASKTLEPLDGQLDFAHSQYCWPSQRNKIHAVHAVHSDVLLLVCFAGVALVGGDQRSFQKRRIFCDPILHFEGPYLQLVLGTRTK